MKIDKGLPIPQANNKKYPWADLKVGDSFFIKQGNIASIFSAGATWAVRNDKERKFSTRKVDGGVRCWRVK